MKKILYLAITLICMTSCYLPRILYSTESVMPSAECDSIEVTLLRGDIISSGGSDPAMTARLDIVNRKTTSVSLLDSPVLELLADNHILLFEEFERKDTLASNSTIPSHERKEVTLYFKSQDDNYVTYQSLKKEGTSRRRSPDSPSAPPPPARDTPGRMASPPSRPPSRMRRPCPRARRCG